MEQTSPPPSKVILVAVGLTALLTLFVIASWRSAAKRTGTVILPGGITYLGPATPSPGSATPALVNGKIPVSSDTKWALHEGKLFPFSFSYPASLSLGVFPDDPFDSVTIFYPGTDSQTNLFFRVENLSSQANQKYLGNVSEFVRNWWRSYTLWKGVEAVTQFTNAHGLTGYRTRYLDSENKVPFEHVFFEVPNRPDLLIWISGARFPQSVFDKLVDSVDWKL